MNILYSDNHIIAINKQAGELVQSDKTGDLSLDKELKLWIKEKYGKPGDVFLGVVHRLDRPVSGVVLFARTSKALRRLNLMFKENRIAKRYWAVVGKMPDSPKGTLVHYMVRNATLNKSFCNENQVKDSKKAVLHYEVIAQSLHYFLLEVELVTGRHHQIRSQLSAIGCPVKGDLKYGFPRPDPGGGIHLHARKISFVHPVRSDENIEIIAPCPDDSLWKEFERKKVQTEMTTSASAHISTS